MLNPTDSSSTVSQPAGLAANNDKAFTRFLEGFQRFHRFHVLVVHDLFCLTPSFLEFSSNKLWPIEQTSVKLHFYP